MHISRVHVRVRIRAFQQNTSIAHHGRGRKIKKNEKDTFQVFVIIRYGVSF